MQHFIKLINKLILSAVFFIALSSISQAQVGIHLGGGLIYGTEVEQLGLNARGTFRFGNWRVAPGIDFFFPEKNGNVRTTVWSINADGNYVFDLPSGIVSPYALAGLSFTTVNVNVDDGFFADSRGSQTELGISIGGGIDFNLRAIKPFAEFKYTFGDFDQAVLTFGLKFGLGSQ